MLIRIFDMRFGFLSVPGDVFDSARFVGDAVERPTVQE
jgi:hypothetical protein